MIFVVGAADKATQEILNRENVENHGSAKVIHSYSRFLMNVESLDLLQINITESYEILPFKTAVMFSYIEMICTSTKWIFPADGDVIIDFEVFIN